MEFHSELSWYSTAATDVGNVRAINEDAVGLRPDIGLWVVADGMGGHSRGDLASTAIVRALDEITYPQDINRFVETVRSKLEWLNGQLFRREGADQMGSTAVVLLAQGSHCACLWVGDSRAYRLRNGLLHAMTRDHSYVQELVQSGELAPERAQDHPNANIVTRAIGAHEVIDVEVAFYDLEDGDRYLLCSDGLYREISELELFQTMCEGSCADVVDRLMALTLSRKAADNVSVLVVDFFSDR